MIVSLKLSWTTGSIAILFFFVGFAAESPAQSIRTVAITGQRIPGDAQRDFGAFDAPTLNDRGHAAFSAGYSSAQGGTDFGIWSEADGTLGLVAHSRFAVAGTDDTFGFHVNPKKLFITNDDRTIFLADTNAGPEGVWVSDDGVLTNVIRSGDPLPGATTPQSFLTVNQLRVTKSGSIALDAAGTLGERGIWTGDAQSLLPLMTVGGQAGGQPGGVNYAGLDIFDSLIASMSDSGTVAFQSRLSGNISNLANDGIFVGTPGAVSTRIQEGLSVGSAIQLDELLSPSANGEGDLAFVARLRGSGVTQTNDYSVWRQSDGQLVQIAREGDAAAGVASGGQFKGFFSPVIGATGDTAFLGYLSGSGIDSSNDYGIWSTNSGSLSLLARAGEPAPGTEPDVHFSRAIDQPVINGKGQIAFAAGLAGPGVGTFDDWGIWAQSTNGDLELIAREGGMMEVAPGDSRRVNRLEFIRDPFDTSSQDGKPSAFNDFGQLTFKAWFDDGTQGVFISNAVATPGLNGDFDGDGDYSEVDVDDLVEEIVAEFHSPMFDVNGDSVVDEQDLVDWLAEAGAAELSTGEPYRFGDANLDGFVDVADFNRWNGSKFTAAAGWSGGDFTADGVVDVSDFNRWNGNRLTASAVPEPVALSMFGCGLLALCLLRRRRR